MAAAFDPVEPIGGSAGALVAPPLLPVSQYFCPALKGLSDALRLAGHRGRHAPVAGKRRARRALQRGLALGRGAVRGPKRVREPRGLGDGARAVSFGGAAVFLATGPTQVEQVKAAAAALEGIGIGTLASAATAA